jgi:hypothetical protein
VKSGMLLISAASPDWAGNLWAGNLWAGNLWAGSIVTLGDNAGA